MDDLNNQPPEKKGFKLLSKFNETGIREGAKTAYTSINDSLDDSVIDRISKEVSDVIIAIVSFPSDLIDRAMVSLYCSSASQKNVRQRFYASLITANLCFLAITFITRDYYYLLSQGIANLLIFLIRRKLTK